MYKHGQLGSVIIISLTITIIVLLLSTIAYSTDLSIVITTLLILGLALFYKLSVSVNNKYIQIKFGVGLVRKKFQLNNIKSVKVVKNKWYHGWGIHFTQDGWIYNVSGWDAVELTMKNKSKVRIGTNDVRNLAKYIRKHL